MKIDIWTFFRTKDRHIAYHKTCLRCVYGCKQSWRVKLIQCPRFLDFRSANFSQKKNR